MSVFEVNQTDREPELSVDYDDLDEMKKQLYAKESEEKGREVYIDEEIEGLFDSFTEVTKGLNDKIQETFDVTLMDDGEINDLNRDELKDKLQGVVNELNLKLQMFARSQERNYSDITDQLEKHATNGVLNIVKSLDPSDRKMANVDTIWHGVEKTNDIAAQPGNEKKGINPLAEMVGLGERGKILREIGNK